MKLKSTIVISAAACMLALAGCSDDDSSSSAESAATTPSVDVTHTQPQLDGATCPTGKPAPGTAPQWEVKGTTGSVAVIGQTDTTAPLITVTTPFTVDKTEVKTLDAGDGAEVTDASTVNVCYEGVNGRTGEVFDSAYQRGEPAEFPASGVVEGFRQALVGQKVGSTVAVVIPSADGYPQGTPDGSIEAGDTIIFALKILSAS